MHDLTNPPIFEAQIGLKLSSEQTVAHLKTLAEALKSEFPEIKPRYEITTEFKADGSDTKTNVIEQGIQLNSRNNDFAIILQKDVFVFCALGKYPGWLTFKNKINGCLESMSKVDSTLQFVEIFSRYLNDIKIEGQYFNLSDYFTFVPSLPKVKPGLILNSFGVNFSASQVETGFQTVFNFTPKQQPKQSNNEEFILDLSVSKRIEPICFSAAIWDNLDKARDIKNYLFFGLITDKLTDRYK